MSYRPDHWKKAQYPSGQAHTPIFGVRASDALAFCTWLTEREGGIWQYRLPKAGEYASDAIATSDLMHVCGYWSNERKFLWIKEPPLVSGTMSTRQTEPIQPVDFDQIIALAHLLASRVVLVNYDDLNRAHVRACDLDLVLDLDRDLDRARDLVLAYGHASAFIEYLATDLTNTLGGTGTAIDPLPFITILVRSHVRALALASALHHGLTVTSSLPLWKRILHPRSRTRYKAIPSSPNLDMSLEIYSTLLQLEKRQNGTLLACEGILIVKERKQQVP